MSGPGLSNWLQERFELARGGASITNLRPMEGLRGVAVLLVFFVHYATLSQPWQSPGGAVAVLLAHAHAVGNAGVDLFFVLSGFLIYGTLMARAQPFAPYMGRRLRRIYPAFLVVLAIYLVLSLAMPSVSKLPAEPADAAWYVLWNLLLLPGMLPIRPIVEVAWSLSYELFYYLVMPAVIAGAALRARSRRWRIGFFLLMLGAGLLLAGVLGGPVRLSLFLAGVLLHEVLGRWPQLRPHSLWAWLGWVLAASVMWWPMPGPALQAWRAAGLCLGFGLVCLVSFRDPLAAAARWLCARPLRWLGNMSYSYYLIHGLALHGFFLLAQRLWPAGEVGSAAALLMLIPALVCTLLVSALLFLAVERPLSLKPAVQPGSGPSRAVVSGSV